MSEQQTTMEALACTGCGSAWTDAELAEHRAAEPLIRSCCPERNMQPIPQTTGPVPCGCHRCQDEWVADLPADAGMNQRIAGPLRPGWRYACEVCGNKRCPHHSDHRLACTGSNALGQPGSIYA
jgi:hypothetical protein